MIEQNIVQGISSKADFDEAIYSKFQMTEAASSTLNVNEFFYDAATDILHVKTDGTKPFFYRLFFPNVNIGDSVEAEFEYYVVTGDINAVTINLFETSARGTTGTNITSVKSKVNGKWDVLKINYPVRNSAQKNLYVGLGLTSGVQPVQVMIKNAKAQVKTVFGVNPSRKVEHFKVGEIQKSTAGWAHYTAFVGDTVTLSEFDANTLLVTYASAFTGRRPIVNVSQEYFSNSYKYIARASESQLGSFKVKFTDATGAVIPLASLSNDIFLSFIAIGEKSVY